ncbi:hypothetical protein AB2L57_09510 [Microbacterium sp. HA-8]|uniref:hypothetical protein n=1 Tax=Microbacterium sp. HA-8 TaxID=3234200 RepID=UPI0038F81FDB
MTDDQLRRIRAQQERVDHIRRDIDRLRTAGAHGAAADRSREAQLRQLEYLLRGAVDELIRLQRA